MQNQIEEILRQKKKLIEKNASCDYQQAYRNVEFFLDSIEEIWREVKISAPPMKHSYEAVHLTEHLASFLLDQVQDYFVNVNKNHTVQLNSMIQRVAQKVDGVNVSQKLKARIQQLSESTSWHGH